MALQSNALTTIANYKTLMGIDPTDTSQDGQIEFLINATSAQFENYCNRKFGIASYFLSKAGSNETMLMLDQYPIVAVTSLNENGNTLDSTQYLIHPDEGLLERLTNQWPLNEWMALSLSPDILYPGFVYNIKPIWSMINNYDITYTAGYILPKDDNSINVLTVNSAGSNYAVNDVLTITQSGATGGTAIVTSIGTGGTVTGLLIKTAGTGYTVATGLMATGGNGNGCNANITAVNSRTLPFDLEMACIQFITIKLNMQGSEHLLRESIGPLRSEFITDIPPHIHSVLDDYVKVTLG